MASGIGRDVRGGAALRRWAQRWRHAEQGQSLVLVIGLVAITLLAISVVLAASAVNLKARQLLAAADGAVIAAVDEFEFVGDGAAPKIRLDPAQLASAVERYLADTNAAGRFDALSVARIGVMPDGQGATITLHASVDPPIIGWVIPGGIPIHVESSARTVLSR